MRMMTPDPSLQRESQAADEETTSHIPILPLYTPEHLSAWDHDRDVGYPGQFP